MTGSMGRIAVLVGVLVAAASCGSEAPEGDAPPVDAALAGDSTAPDTGPNPHPDAPAIEASEGDGAPAEAAPTADAVPPAGDADAADAVAPSVDARAESAR